MVWPDAKLLATDVDPIAIEVAKSNCTLNNQVKIKTLCAEGVDDPTIKQSGPYDLLIANILAKPLIELAPAIPSLLASNGILLLSGILETQGDDVTNAYTREGLIHKRTDQFDEWVTILFKER
jgi:ribosomal protein L11 methyltransferase